MEQQPSVLDPRHIRPPFEMVNKLLLMRLKARLALHEMEEFGNEMTHFDAPTEHQDEISDVR